MVGGLRLPANLPCGLKSNRCSELRMKRREVCGNGILFAAQNLAGNAPKPVGSFESKVHNPVVEGVRDDLK
jgi:hypothetical protein